MNNREIRFRESFRGYNRDDVKAYIEQLNLIFARKESELRGYINEIETKLNSIPPQTQNSHTDDEWDELAAKLEAAQNEIKRLNDEIATREEEEKSSAYDAMSAQVGNIIISANANADKIVSEAKEEAERIRSDADIYASSVRTEANKAREEILCGITEKVKSFAVECVSQYGTIIGETSVKLENIGDNLKTRSDSLLKSLEIKSNEIKSKLTIRSEE